MLTTVLRFKRSISKAYWLFIGHLKKKRFKACGPHTKIKGRVSISCPEKIEIGDHTSLNAGVALAAEGGISIGSYVHFAGNITINSENHTYNSKKALPFDNKGDAKPVRIDDFVWIGKGVMIVPGVHIGEGAVIGMGAVVTKDVPPLAVVGGNPAQVLKYRDAENFERLKREKKFLRYSDKIFDGKCYEPDE